MREEADANAIGFDDHVGDFEGCGYVFAGSELRGKRIAQRIERLVRPDQRYVFGGSSLDRKSVV